MTATMESIEPIDEVNDYIWDGTMLWNMREVEIKAES